MRSTAWVALVAAASFSCAGGHDLGGRETTATPPAKSPTPKPQASVPPPPPSAYPAYPAPPLPPPANASGAARQIAAAADVDLKGYRVDAKPGDFMLTSDGAVAVVSVEGRVIDYGPAGGRDELVSISPSISMGMGERGTDTAQISIVGDGGRVVRVDRPVLGKPALLVSFVYFTGKILRVDSVAVGTGDDPALAATLGELAAWGTVPTWVEGHGFIAGGGVFPGEFIARESFGVAYALCSDAGRLLTRFSWPDLPGLYQSARTGEGVALIPQRGVSMRRSIAIAYGTSLGDAALSLPCSRRGPSARAMIPLLPIEGARADIYRCGIGGAPGTPYVEINAQAERRPGGDKRGLDLPNACFMVRYRAPGHAPGAWTEARALTSPLPPAARPQAGTIRWQVTEQGKPVPARLVVRGADGAADPHWGDDATLGAALNVIHSEQGKGERPIPPGKYRVTVTRGFEYTAHEADITVSAGKPTSVQAALDRVVDTKGWVAADLHLHAVPSSDAPSLLADRVRSLVAAGIEVGVATDHNKITDYGPTIRELGLGGKVASVIGDEVTTRELWWGHFNVFPLAAGSEPLPYRATLPSAIFAAARAAKPYGPDTIVQVNHPRMGDIGYFEIFRMDPTDVAGWRTRSPAVDMGFDTIEVFNGDEYDKLHRVEDVMRDWYALLNAGFRYTATGNSDSHKISFHEAGTPRNLVAVPSDSPGTFDERAFVEAVRGGRVVVSSGPFVQITAGGKGVGSTISEGMADIVVRVDGPPWVDVDKVQVIRRGEVLREWGAADLAGARPLELRASADLKKGDWVIAIARGSKPMPFLYRQGAKPFGFTNAIYVK